MSWYWPFGSSAPAVDVPVTWDIKVSADPKRGVVTMRGVATETSGTPPGVFSLSIEGAWDLKSKTPEVLVKEYADNFADHLARHRAHRGEIDALEEFTADTAAALKADLDSREAT